MTPPALARRFAVDSAGAGQAALTLRVGLTVFAFALPALTLLEYAVPMDFRATYWGLGLDGMEEFREHLGLSRLPRLDPSHYSLGFHSLLILLWTGYALALLGAFHLPTLKARPTAFAICGVAVVTAIFVPPLLSADVYAYAGHGRIFALYGQNPYLRLPMYLVDAHDAVAPYLVWNWPTVYGPVWTRIEILIAALLHGSSLWTQIVGLKLVQAGALVMAALAGRRITQILSPGRENLTLLAIGLNPLLLIEGPGSGHNDMLMISFLMVGAMFYLEKKYLLASLFLGLSVGVKSITIVLLPWALMEYGRGRPWKQKLIALLAACALVAVPLLVCYGRLWGGANTFAAMNARSFYHMSPATLAQDHHFYLWLKAHGVQDALASPLVTLFQDRMAVAVYAVLSLWLLRRRESGSWLTGWIFLAPCLMLILMGLPFPWYIIWFWPVCLLRWDRLHLSLSAACFIMSLIWVGGYGVWFQP